MNAQPNHRVMSLASCRRRSLAAPSIAMLAVAAASVAVGARAAAAQRPTLSTNTRQYVALDTSLLALTNVRVIDGTGAPARDGQTIVIRDGKIAAVGPAASTPVPAGALVRDLAGK